MRFFRVLSLAAAAALFAFAPLAHADHKDSKAYQECFKRGQDDARHGNAGNLNINHWKHSDERQACQDGYRAGFNSVSTAVANPNSLPQGEAPGAAFDSARNVGYQDGLMDGRNDRNAGHSFRPTDTDNYKHADRTYQDSFGNKDSWKAAYRQGYADGYREGFKNH
ncbi:MAG TPA: hypothetical protein VE998_03555 [Terriglobales bacterium]|nr:hypothetical protein [Terriglobales bacterium]